MILIPTFHSLRQERVAYKLGPTDKKIKERNACIFRLSLC